MNCIHCQGILNRGQAPLHIDRNSIHVTLDNVPAWVCEQCGEPMFDEQEVETIQELVKLLEDKSQAFQQSA